jgi:subtilisin family serine protease
MPMEMGDRIYSNDYFDLIITYAGDISYLEQFPNSTYQLIVPYTAIIRVPAQQITDKTIAELGFRAIPTLDGIISQSALEASGITRTRNIPILNLRGQGVLIGIVDTGIDYTNSIFKYADNTTKIAALWDQTIVDENYVSNTYYGIEYTREQINQALRCPNPYEVVPSRDEIGHGTMIAGIIAGNEVQERSFSGVVPDAELVVVKLKPAKQNIKEFWRVSSDAICYQENDIAFALEYLEMTANKIGRPMSICLALGTSLSSHDNKSEMNTILSLRAENLNFAITAAAGNEGNARRHFYGTINPSIGFDTVELNIGVNEGGFAMELWGDSPGLFGIDIKTPTGEYIPRIPPRINENYDITFVFEKTRILIDYQIVEAQSGDQLILFRFTDPSPGIWTFNVYGRGDLSPSFHIWLPMSGFISNETYFIRSDPYTTLLSFGNANEPITATAYNTMDDSLYIDSSRGYTRLGNIKPDIAAPGVNIMSPTLNQDFMEVTGTSPAAAHTAGVAAMILEWGIVKKNLPYITTSDVKIMMIRGARRNTDIIYPNREWGYGILDVFNIFSSLSRGI